MVVLLPKFSWCIAHTGSNGNWWIKEVSEDRNWDFEVPSLLSPEQVKKVLKQSKEELEPYGFLSDAWNSAFFRFRIDKRLNDGCVRLVRTEERLQNEEEPLFALPNEIEENSHPYVDFLDALIRARVAFLNDHIDFVQALSPDEVKEMLREVHHALYFEGASLHVFRELSDILDYIPDGFEIRQAE